MEIIDASRLTFAAKSKAECRSELIEARWSGQFKCPKCAHEKGYWIRKRALFECANRNCRKQTSPTAGTQFHKTRDLQSLWLVLKESDVNSNVRSGFVRERTGISYSSSRKMIQKFCAYKRLSITMLPTTFIEAENDAPRRNKSEKNSVLPLPAKAASKLFCFFTQYPTMSGPEVRLSSSRAVAVGCQLRHLTTIASRASDSGFPSLIPFKRNLRQFAHYVHPDLKTSNQHSVAVC